jgi:serine/threonine protein kinase
MLSVDPIKHPTTWVAKYIDFGFACNRKMQTQTCKRHSLSGTFHGGYMPPEKILNWYDPQTKKDNFFRLPPTVAAKLESKAFNTMPLFKIHAAHDIWALGITLLEVITSYDYSITQSNRNMFSMLNAGWISITCDKNSKYLEDCMRYERHPIDNAIALCAGKTDIADLLDQVIRPMIEIDARKRCTAKQALSRLRRLDWSVLGGRPP